MIHNETSQRKAYVAPEFEILGEVATLTATCDGLEGGDPAGSGPIHIIDIICNHSNFPFCGCGQ